MYKRDILGNANLKAILQEIESIANGKDVALCCYEIKQKECHRQMIAQWFTERGIIVEEYMPKREKVVINNQISLF